MFEVSSKILNKALYNLVGSNIQQIYPNTPCEHYKWSKILLRAEENLNRYIINGLQTRIIRNKAILVPNEKCTQ